MIPHGDGAFTVHRFAPNTEADRRRIHDSLQGQGDWVEATFAEWDEWTAAVEAIAGILNGKEWCPIFLLDESQRKLIRGAINGQWMLKAAEELQGDDSTSTSEPEEGAMDSESKEGGE